MEQNELIILAEEAIDEFFTDIDDVVDSIVKNIIDKYGLDDDLSEDDKKFLKNRITRGILKRDDKQIKEEIDI